MSKKRLSPSPHGYHKRGEQTIKKQINNHRLQKKSDLKETVKENNKVGGGKVYYLDGMAKEVSLK